MVSRFFRRLILFVFALTIFALAIGYWQYNTVLSSTMLSEGEDIVHVARGDNITTIAHDLHERGFISQPLPLIIYARVHDVSGSIQAGDYSIDASTTPISLINKMIDGDVIINTITVIEGRTFAQMLSVIAAHPYINHTLDDYSAADIAAELNIDGSPEGWFLPDTYQFQMGTSDMDLLKRMHQAMQATLDEAWANKADDLPLKTPYEALILASIIEKETGVDSERTQVAGVFIRRLEQNMRLQTDPSVIYGAKNYQGTITKTHLTTDSPYNTYTRHGLPPTPIALPSRAAIDAALHPDDSNSLYFVADGKGGHVFSDTYAEHQQAVAAYRRAQKAVQ